MTLFSTMNKLYHLTPKRPSTTSREMLATCKTNSKCYAKTTNDCKNEKLILIQIWQKFSYQNISRTPSKQSDRQRGWNHQLSQLGMPSCKQVQKNVAQDKKSKYGY